MNAVVPRLFVRILCVYSEGLTASRVHSGQRAHGSLFSSIALAKQ